MISKKEEILARIKELMENIKTTNTYDGYNYFNNNVGYVDRQYINITENDILNKPTNWIVINNESEEFEPLPGGNFENKLQIQIVGFTKADEDKPDLDTLMNTLQRDIFLSIMKDETLGNLCDYVMPVMIETVSEMVYPYGGFVFSFDITYSFFKSNI
jgi:hypothetical protein